MILYMVRQNTAPAAALTAPAANYHKLDPRANVRAKVRVRYRVRVRIRVRVRVRVKVSVSIDAVIVTSQAILAKFCSKYVLNIPFSNNSKLQSLI